MNEKLDGTRPIACGGLIRTKKGMRREPTPGTHRAGSAESTWLIVLFQGRRAENGS